MSERSPSRNPSYRLHKPSQQAVVTINGRDHYLGRFGSAESRQDYDRLIAEWLANNRQMVWDRSALTMAEIMAKYLAFAEGYYVKDGRPTSEQDGIAQALRPVRRLYSRTAAAEFSPQKLKAVRQALVDHGLCRTVVNQAVGRIRRMMRWAVENELVPPGVYHGLLAVGGLKRGRTEARETDPVRPVADQYVDAIRDHVARQACAIIELQRLTGMRAGEVVIMRGCDLDTTGSLWLYTPSTHKTEHHGHSRAIELGPRAQDVIRGFLKPDLHAYLFSPTDAVAEQVAAKRRKRKSKVQPGQRDRSKPNPKRKAGERYTASSYRRAIQRGCDLAWPVPSNVKDPGAIRSWRKSHRWHPHQLRHNYATRIRKEFGVEAARILLGHRSTAVTELYAEIDRGRVRDIVSRVG
jgi:integrase